MWSYKKVRDLTSAILDATSVSADLLFYKNKCFRREELVPSLVSACYQRWRIDPTKDDTWDQLIQSWLKKKKIQQIREQSFI